MYRVVNTCVPAYRIRQLTSTTSVIFVSDCRVHLRVPYTSCTYVCAPSDPYISIAPQSDRCSDSRFPITFGVSYKLLCAAKYIWAHGRRSLLRTHTTLRVVRDDQRWPDTYSCACTPYTLDASVRTLAHTRSHFVHSRRMCVCVRDTSRRSNDAQSRKLYVYCVNTRSVALIASKQTDRITFVLHEKSLAVDYYA